jgi:hypothetical protein
MSIQPTRAEWMESRDQLCATYSFSASLAGQVMETVCCPCPPEPAPPAFELLHPRARKGARGRHPFDGRVVVTQSLTAGLVRAVYAGDITPDEADAMACSLIEHAAYARKQAEPDESICGRFMGSVGSTHLSCQRPEGHTLPCTS